MLSDKLRTMSTTFAASSIESSVSCLDPMFVEENIQVWHLSRGCDMRKYPSANGIAENKNRYLREVSKSLTFTKNVRIFLG